MRRRTCEYLPTLPYLADRCCRNRIGIELDEQLANRAAEFTLDPALPGVHCTVTAETVANRPAHLRRG